MNTTNRGANRGLLLIVGLLLIAGGATSVLLGTVQQVRDGWTAWFRSAGSSLPVWSTQPLVGRVGWLAILVSTAAVVLIVLLIAFVVRQGNGRTAAVVEHRADGGGRTRVDLSIPRTLLTDHLQNLPDVLGSRVTAYDVRGTPTLKVSVRARRGVSPAVVTDQVVQSLHALDQVLGEQIPAYVQVSGGFRARTGSRARVA